MKDRNFSVKAAAAKLYMSLSLYMSEFASNEGAFADKIKEPPTGSMNRIAAAEWRRVAPRLYDIGRITPRSIIALHGYCGAYAFWLKLHRQVKQLGREPSHRADYSELSSVERQEQNFVKQLARTFGFFLDDSGRMNLDQPLPLESKQRRKK